MPPVLDNNGNLVPLGKVQRTITEPFLSGTLPSWLSVTGGAGVYTAPSGASGTYPNYSIASAATANSQAAMASSITVNSTHLLGIIWSASLWTDGSDNNYGIALSLYGGALGGWIGQAAGAASGSIVANGPTRSTVLVGTAPLATANEAKSKRNISIVYVPPAREIWWMEDDQVVAWQAFASGNWGDGVLTPNITLTTAEAVSHTLYLSQVSLTICHN
jgi:hypothetical protein